MSGSPKTNGSDLVKHPVPCITSKRLIDKPLLQNSELTAAVRPRRVGTRPIMHGRGAQITQAEKRTGRAPMGADGEERTATSVIMLCARRQRRRRGVLERPGRESIIISLWLDSHGKVYRVSPSWFHCPAALSHWVCSHFRPLRGRRAHHSLTPAPAPRTLRSAPSPARVSCRRCPLCAPLLRGSRSIILSSSKQGD